MSAALNDLPRRKRFTRIEVEQLEESGFFSGQRYELLEGDLIDKMGQNPLHAFVICLLQTWLIIMFGSERIRVQLPIEVDIGDQKWSLPEPDLSIIYRSSPEFQNRFPQGHELLLVIEVADSSARQDLTTKRDLYARAGVTEYWVLDVKQRRLVVHKQPVAGSYESIAAFTDSEIVTLEVANKTFVVKEILPAETIA